MFLNIILSHTNPIKLNCLLGFLLQPLYSIYLPKSKLYSGPSSGAGIQNVDVCALSVYIYFRGECLITYILFSIVILYTLCYH